VIFLGGQPTECLGFDAACNEHVTNALSKISRLNNVHDAPDGSLAKTLKKLRIQPRAQLATRSPWFTQWRHDPDNGADYVFLFNNLERSSSKTILSSGFVEFETTGIPYRLDPWTGEHTPIPTYTQAKHTTRIFFELAEGESVLLAFIPGPSRPDHLTFTTGPILDIAVPSDSSRHNAKTVKIRNAIPGLPSRATIKEANGKIHAFKVLVESPRRLQDWTLTVEHWDPPKDLYDTYGTVKWNSTYKHLNTLKPWTSISLDLIATSGRGFYTTSFTWNPTSRKSSGAYLDLPPISHTVQVRINAQAVGPINIYRPRIDITPYLVNGKNTIEIIIATPLGNALRPIWKKLVTGGHFYAEGSENIAPVPVQAEYGLVGDVRVVPFVECRGGRECGE
jgi:hypothetical protein